MSKPSLIWPEDVNIIEVGARDGLQNEAKFLATEDKIKFINKLASTGLTNIEVTSFVSPKFIPQLADNKEVFKKINKPRGINFPVLVPNKQGMIAAINAGVEQIAIFTAASESFNQRNINCSISESIKRFLPVVTLAREHSIKIRAYISCVLGCPYEGIITPAQVLKVAKQLLEFDIYEISFGDTIGVGTPKQTIELLTLLKKHIPVNKIAMHFHDTYGQALANIFASLTLGINNFDSSVAGLGGCPYAQGASGNVATEDVLYLLQGLGIRTGIDIFKVVEAGDMICKILGKKNQSKVSNALRGNR